MRVNKVQPKTNSQFLDHDMNRFDVAWTWLKQYLRKGRKQPLYVRTFAGDFVAQRDENGQPASYGDYLTYAESGHDLKLVVSDLIRISDKKQLQHKTIKSPDGIEAFNQKIAGCCLDFAKYVVVLRNRLH